jgi:hypothetical protein
MIYVSDRWRTAQSDVIVPESYVKISYEATEPGLHEMANLSHANWSDNPSSVNIIDSDDMQPKYVTMERNRWLLDGECKILPDDVAYGDTGFVSQFRGAGEGEIAIFYLPTIELSFDLIRTQAIPGVTIVWSSAWGEWAARVRITAYNAAEQIFSQEFESDSVRATYPFTLSNYTRIKIEVLNWSMPFHNARVESVFIGTVTEYTRTELINFSHTQSGDILSGELPKNSVTFSLNNADGIWNPDNPTGDIKHLAERQEIQVQYGMKFGDDIEWIDAGTFWVSEWETPANGMEVNFGARDALLFMSDTYTGSRTGTLYDIAMAAFEQSDIPKLSKGKPRYVISQQLARWSTDFSTDTSDYTNAEIVQLCANAACCVFYQDRKGVLRVEPVRENASGYVINKFLSYSHPDFALTKPLKAVSVNNGLGTANNTSAGEIQTLENPMITNSTNAVRVAEWVRKTLESRKILSGEYRADPRLDVFDKIAVESKYGVNNAIYVTEITYTYNGSFKGKYTGRATVFDAEEWYSGELISGEV